MVAGVVVPMNAAASPLPSGPSVTVGVHLATVAVVAPPGCCLRLVGPRDRPKFAPAALAPVPIENRVALRARFDTTIDAVVSPMGRGLARLGVTPNALTTMGLVLTGVAAGLVVAGEPVIGGWALVLGGLMDTLDGAVARADNRSTPFGAFYDSVSDRLSDGIILAGVAFWLRDQPRLFALTITALVAAQVTSYVRAKAEAIDLECQIGILERAERAIILMFGLVFWRWILEPVLWILAVGGVVTIIQRVHHVWCQVARDLPDELMVLAAGGRAWNRAFKEAARRLYGAKNFDAAWEDMVASDGDAPHAAQDAGPDAAPDAASDAVPDAVPGATESPSGRPPGSRA